MREQVDKLRNTLFFQCFTALESRKVGSSLNKPKGNPQMKIKLSLNILNRSKAKLM